jgi:hypothetical protein
MEKVVIFPAIPNILIAQNAIKQLETASSATKAFMEFIVIKSVIIALIRNVILMGNVLD